MPCTEPRPGAHRRGAALLLALLVAPTARADAGIGYASVARARAALVEPAGARSVEIAGWTVVDDAASPAHTRWSFAPRSHPAYPALVRRDLVQRDGVPTLVTWFLCEGRRAPCEALYAGLRAGSVDVP
ncbi:MAG: hypothetical protein AB7Q81_13325 [Gammaproteobacteria bacterium]